MKFDMKHQYRLFSALRKIKIQYRLLAVFCFISLVPVISIGFYAYTVYTDSINKKLGASTFQAISSLNHNMIIELEKFQDYCNIVSVSAPIQNALSVDSDNKKLQPQEIAASINKVITTIPFQSNYLKNFRVVNASGKILYDLGYDDIPQELFMKILAGIDQVSPRDSLQYVHTYRSKDKLVLGRRLYVFGSVKDPIGYIMIYIDEALIRNKIFSEVSFGKGSDIMLVSNDGFVMSAQSKEAIGTSLMDSSLFSDIQVHLKNGENSFNTELDGRKYLITFAYNSQFDNFLVASIPKSYITDETYRINLTLLCLSAFLVLLSICCTTIVYISIVTPIRGMVSFCIKASEHLPSSGIADTSPDELGLLSGTIDAMLDKLHLLMEQNREEEIKKRRLELQMLQYQINPHFLFNTLDSLQWVAVINDVPVLAKGISSLSSLLRNTLVKKDELIELEEEINNLNDYFYIQKIRYGNSFDVEYRMAPDTLRHLLPRFILQPLAENAILHGASNSTIITITVSSYYTMEELIIEISDNGKGFSVQDENEKKEKSSLGIGTSNVRERLRIYYGADNILQIISQEGKGTLCRITIPKNTEKENLNV